MPGLAKGQRKLSLTEQKEVLLSRLNSEQHYAETPTLAYGDHEPFMVFLATCDTCLKNGQLIELSGFGARSRWQVICRGCSKTGGEPTRNPWTASLMWNGVNLKTQRYVDLPLFGLAGLNPHQAHDRIKQIRSNLELRISLSDVETQLFKAGISTRKPGTAYGIKLDAYLKWAMLAHRLIKIAKTDRSTKDQHSGQIERGE